MKLGVSCCDLDFRHRRICPLVGPLARDLGIHPAHDRRARSARQRLPRLQTLLCLRRPKNGSILSPSHYPQIRAFIDPILLSSKPSDGGEYTIWQTQPPLRDTKPFVHRSSSWRGTVRGSIIFRKGELPTFFDLPRFLRGRSHIQHPCPPK